MRKVLMSLLVLAAACGGTATETTEPSQGEVTTTPEVADPTTSTATGDTDTTEASDATDTSEGQDGPTSDLPLAPDFTLELGTGGEYTLSDTDNPVYLVFWAEW